MKRTKWGTAARRGYAAPSRIYAGGQVNAPVKISDTNIGREGYVQCPKCDRFVKVRLDHTLYGHNMLTAGKIPCLGSHGLVEDV